MLNKSLFIKKIYNKVPFMAHARQWGLFWKRPDGKIQALTSSVSYDIVKKYKFDPIEMDFWVIDNPNGGWIQDKWQIGWPDDP
jgi:hypothetical protein